MGLREFEAAPPEIQQKFYAALGDELARERERAVGSFQLHGLWPKGFLARTAWDETWERRAGRQRLRSEGRLRDDGFGLQRERLLSIPPPEYFLALADREPLGNHKVECPLHEERTRSCHVYPAAEKGWHCFGCGRGGTIYDLAGGLWGLPLRGRPFREVHGRLLGIFF